VSVGFIKKKFVTMHGHMNVKPPILSFMYNLEGSRRLYIHAKETNYII